MAFSFPLIYPILDTSFLPATGRAAWLSATGLALADAGCTLLEYRNKTGSDAELLADCALLRAAMPAGQVRLILDDRLHLVREAGFDGVHVDAGDASPAEARAALGPEAVIGTFGGSTDLLPGVLEGPADYLAIGPVFATTTKVTDKPPIGATGVARLRQQAGEGTVLVAAAGITLATARQVLDSGANTVAVAAGIFAAADPARELGRWQYELMQAK